MAAGEGSGGSLVVPEGAGAGVGEVVRARRRYARTKDTVKWSKALGRRICKRVAAGELLYVVLREDGMPTAQSVGRWAKEQPAFGAELAQARRECGRDPAGPAGGGGGVWLYNEGLAREVFERLCDGESLTEIGEDATMPCLSTLYYWRRRFPEFDAQIELGKRIQAERYCDEGMEIARAATRETAYATHVLLTQIRWTAGVMAPRVFRTKPAELPADPRRVNVIMKRYSAEVHPETGLRHMVTWDVDPDTGGVTKTWSEWPFPTQELWGDKKEGQNSGETGEGQAPLPPP